MADVSPNITELVCPDRQIHLPTLIHGCQFLAIILCLTLGFLEKRRNRCPDCCGGRPGLIIPINLLDDFENRWAYASSFGAITNTIVLLLLGGQAISENSETAVKVSLGLAFSIEVCIAFCPFFACLISTHKFVSSIIGFLYVSLWFAAITANTIQCINPFPEVVLYLGLVVNIPCLVCLGFLLFKFLIVAVKSAINKKFVEEVQPYKVSCEFQIEHVEDIFRKIQEEEEEPGRCTKIYQFLLKMFCNGKEDHFRFSTRMICTIFVVFMCLYQLGTLYYYFNAWIFYSLREQVDDLVNLTGVEENSTLVEGVDLGLTMLTIGWDIMNGFVFTISGINLILILAKYRLNLRQLYRGDRTFLPREYRLTSAEALRSCMLFSGYQIAYQIWGYFIFVIAGWVIVVILSLVIILPIALGTWAVMLWLAQILIIPGAISLLLRYSQKLMAQFVFLQDKLDKDDDDKPLAITNRKLYHIMNYFLFIANIQVGLFSSIYRIAKSFVWGLLYLGRIDMCVLMPGKEELDKGYNAYVGMLLVEHTHNNPTLRTFCQILLNTTHEQPRDTPYDVISIHSAKYQDAFHKQTMDDCKDLELVAIESLQVLPGNTSDKTGDKNGRKCLSCSKQSMTADWPKAPSSTYARTRWHLIYTLYNNPQLIAARKHHIMNTSPEKIKLTHKVLDKFKTSFLGVDNPTHNTRNHNSLEVQILVNKRIEDKARYSVKLQGKEPVENSTISTSDVVCDDPSMTSSDVGIRLERNMTSPDKLVTPENKSMTSTDKVMTSEQNETSPKPADRHEQNLKNEPTKRDEIGDTTSNNEDNTEKVTSAKDQTRASPSNVLLSPTASNKVHPQQ